ncbi:M20/M25/M40 family metallo-hydrolase [Ornithinimicrobium panacihumi]|uniref:M20/M25/M40 family metallo-hydrolase n=1 Tax=Ornithinimicrobium panacihumi TaxID=2008449 RepID=UPI003F89D7A4
MRTPTTRSLSLLAASTLLTTAAIPALAAPNPNNPDKLVAAIDADSLWGHMEAFYAAAEDNGGNRAAGTPGYDASVDYVVGELEAAGYDVELQEFEFTYTETLRQELRQTSPVERDLESTVFTYSPSGQADEAELAAPSGDPLGCTADAYGGADLTGQIALVSRGDCPFAEKSLAAAAVGAEAVIIYNNTDGAINGTLGAPSDDYIATLGVSGELGQELVAQLADGPVTVDLDLEQLVEQRTTVNVLAETATGRDDNVVMVGAHLDGVPEGPGMNDNASGAAATLEIAKRLAPVNKVNNTVRFAFWGAEEIGLLGADHYVSELSQAERDAIAIYVNLDMVAPQDHQNTLGVLQGDFSLGAERLLIDQLEADEHPTGPAGNGNNSDYAPFVAAGIPATGLLSYYDSNYHTAQDDLDNVSLTSLTHSARAVAALVGEFAYHTSLINDTCSAGRSGKPKDC